MNQSKLRRLHLVQAIRYPRLLLLLFACSAVGEDTAAFAAVPSSSLQTVVLSGQPVPGLSGATFPANFHPVTFLEPQINSAGQLLFVAGLPTSNGYAILSGTPEDLRLVAATGQSAPETEAGTVFHAFYDAPLAFNDRGEVAFLARLRGPTGLDRGSGIWTQSAGETLRKVARTGDMPPDVGTGVLFRSFGGPRISNHGHMIFDAEYGTPPGASQPLIGGGHFSELPDRTLHFLARTGMEVPGEVEGTVEIHRVNLTRGGEFYIAGLAHIRDRFTTTTVAGIWHGESHAMLQPVFGAQLPTNSARFENFFSYGFMAQPNETGYFAVVGRVRGLASNFSTTRNGLFVIQPDGGIRPVALENNQPPDTPAGSFYTSDFYHFEINDAGRTAFRASLALPGDFFQRRAIFAEGNDGQTRLVALQNTPAPGTPSGVVFGSPIWSSYVQDAFDPPAFNNFGQVAFLAELEGPGVTDRNSVGLWATDRNGVLILIAREGDPLAIAPGDIRTVAELRFVGGRGDAWNRLTGLNDVGQITFSARFSDGTSGLFVSHLVAVPEPNAVFLLLATIPFVVRHGRAKHRP